MLKKRLLLTTLAAFLFVVAFAQKGTLQGTIIDEKLNEPLFGVTVVIEGTTTGASTDFDGTFSFPVEAGTHKVVTSYIGYVTQTKEVTITADEVTIIDFNLLDQSTELDLGVVITAKKVTNTVQAMDNLQMKSTNVINAISSQSIQKSGDSNAAGALKRVAGVSVAGGKYVYVRGLSDRYTKSVLNGLEIPGLDPDKNNVQMDIFPSSIINNIVVNKTFVPSLPGDFTGGVVNIQTKDFPEEKTMSFSYGTTFRTNTHFNKNYISYQGSSTDLLGFDDGTRALPFAKNIITPHPSSNDVQLSELTKKFNPQMGIESANNFLDQSIGFNFGNRKKMDKLTFGYNTAINYSTNSKFYEDAKFGEYQVFTNNAEQYAMQPFRKSTANIGSQEASLSGLVAASVKVKDTKISANLFRVQNAESTAIDAYDIKNEDNDVHIKRNSLFFEQRALTNASIIVDQKLGNLEATFKTSGTLSNITNPDLRTTALTENLVKNELGIVTDTTYRLSVGDGSIINRDWRFLKEQNLNNGLDFVYNLNHKNETTSKLKFGALHTYKARNFNVYSYNFVDRASLKDNNYDFNPDFFFEDENIWTPQSEASNSSGFYVSSSPQAQNQYKANSNVIAAYAMHEMPINNRLDVTYGLRAEKAQINFTGESFIGEKFNNEKILDDFALLPAANATFKIAEKSNLRASYSKTLARPSFKEKSTVSIFDPIAGRRFSGNINVNATDIHNFDLRYENFFNSGEMFSVSGFYKHFNNPIFLIFELTASDEIKPQNSEYAKVLGAEFEFRKNIIEGLQFGVNGTIMNSKVKLTDDEIVGRKANLREGEEFSEYRTMFGQSPFLVNTYLNFGNKAKGLEANLSYNVEGKKIAVVGIGSVPSVYELPFHSLNFKASKKLNDQFNLSLTAKNILGQKERKYFQSYNAEDEIFSELYRGRLVGLSLSFKPGQNK